MDKPFKVGLVAALMAATISSEQVLAQKATAIRKQPPTFFRSSINDVRCVERSFSVSVGNPAYRSRLAIWPAPCSR
jgi:hypothetical protein